MLVEMYPELMMEATGTAETSVYFHQPTWYHIPEDRKHYGCHRGGNIYLTNIQFPEK
jgi:hypothetical protein